MESRPGYLNTKPVSFYKWITAENKLCGKHNFMVLHILFSK